MKMKMMMAGSLIVSFKAIFKNPFLFLEPASRIRSFHSDSASNRYPRSMFEKITKLDDALQLFDEMIQRQPLPSVVKFNQLLQAVTKMQHYSCVIDLFKQMTTIGAPVDVYTTNIAIKCCCQMSCTSEGFAIMAYGLKRGVVPDVYTFNTILNGLILEDRILEAERIFKKLIKEKLCVPTVVTLNTMIKGLCKFGNNETSIALVKLMDERGCKPNVVTYRVLLQGLLKNKQLDTIETLLQEMDGRGFLLDASTLGMFLDHITPESADATLLKLIGKLNSDIIVYTILIDGACKCGKLDIARDLFNDVSVQGLQHNVRSYNVMISGFCQEGLVGEAIELFLQMNERGCLPDVVTYNTLISGLCREGLVGEAKELFLQMDERGCPPNSVTNRVLLQGLIKNKQPDMIETLLQVMDGRGFLLDASTLGMFLDHITPESADAILLKLIGKLGLKWSGGFTHCK